MMYIFDSIKKELEDVLNKEAGSLKLEIPPEHVDGDFAVSVGDPNKTKELAEKINGKELEFIENAKAAGPFLNITLKKSKVYNEVIKEVKKIGEDYGNSSSGKGKKALIEYSSPNIAKPIGVGHLRSTVIGEALARVYEALGFTVIRDNFLGDWGTQFGKLIYAYKKWGDKDRVAKNPMEELKDLYVRFEKEAQNNDSLEEKAREISKKLEEKDKEFEKLWKEFRNLSIKEFEKIYDVLNIKFDHYTLESNFVQKAKEIIEDGLGDGRVKETETGTAVAVEMDGLPSYVLMTQNGYTLYIARDLAALKGRLEEYKPDVFLYVVGNEQTLHFKQMFAFAKKAGYLNKKTEVKHVPFGMVLFGGKKMSTRKGTAVSLEKLIEESVKRSGELIKQKSPDLTPEEQDKISKIVGIGAVVYSSLRQSREKNIVFDWDKALDIESASAPYLQYTYARINSIIKKAEDLFDKNKAGDNHFEFENESEFELVKQILIFPKVVRSVITFNSPHIICTYLEKLAHLFNSFYNDISVIKTKDDDLRRSRLELVASVALVIKKGLELLNVKTPERM